MYFMLKVLWQPKSMFVPQVESSGAISEFATPWCAQHDCVLTAGPKMRAFFANFLHSRQQRWIHSFIQNERFYIL